MNLTLPLGRLSVMIVAGLSLGSVTPSVQAASPSSSPRIGSRIYLYFKDLAYGDNPYDRYRTGPPPRPQQPRPMVAQPRQHAYGTAPRGPRYNLDQPPPATTAPRPQNVPVPRMANQPAPAPDLPYAMPPTPAASEPETALAGVGAQVEATPKVTVKSKPGTAKPAPEVEKPAPAEEKPAPRQITPPPPQAPTQVVSNTSAGKSWQGMSSEEPVTKTSPPPGESKPAPDASTTLTGSKTGKDGRVKSPYPPYNELDVTGLPTGSLAMDPTTGKVFRVP